MVQMNLAILVFFCFSSFDAYIQGTYSFIPSSTKKIIKHSFVQLEMLELLVDLYARVHALRLDIKIYL